MLLHVYVGDVRLDFAPDPETISGFSLVIKRKDTDMMFRLASLSFQSTIIRFHQTCHVPIELVTTGDLAFELNAIKRKEEVAILGKASCLTSVVENHAMKILQLLNADGVTIGKISVTLAYQQTVKSMDEEDKNLKYIFQNRILSQREYNFLLSRRFNWPGDRPSSWNAEYEEYLNADPSLILKDIRTSVINPVHRVCRGGAAVAAEEDPITKAFDRKVRRTHKDVGYLGVAWPDNNLYGRQVFESMRELNEIKRRQQFEIKENLRSMKAALHQQNLEELQVNKAIVKKNDQMRRSIALMQQQDLIAQEKLRAQEALLTRKRAESVEASRRGARERSEELLRLRREEALRQQTQRSASLAREEARQQARRSVSLGRDAVEDVRRAQDNSLRRSASFVRLESSRQSARSLQPVLSNARGRSAPAPVRYHSDNIYASRDSRRSSTEGVLRSTSAGASARKKVAVKSASAGKAASRASPAVSKASSRRIQRSASVSRADRSDEMRSRALQQEIDGLLLRSIGKAVPATAKKSVKKKLKKVKKKAPVTAASASKAVKPKKKKLSTPAAASGKKPVSSVKVKSAVKSAAKKSDSSLSMKVSKKSSSAKTPSETAEVSGKKKSTLVKTRMSRQRASNDSGTGSTTKLVKELDSLIQNEKIKTWNKLRELSNIQIEADEQLSLLEQLDNRNRHSVSFAEPSPVKLELGQGATASPLTRQKEEGAAEPREVGDERRSATSTSTSSIIIPLYRRETDQIAHVSQSANEAHYFSDSSSSSFQYNGQDEVDTEASDFQERVARFISKANEKKYRYLGKEERPLSHFGSVGDWNRYAPLKETLDQQALDASNLSTDDIVTSSEDDEKVDAHDDDVTHARLSSIVSKIDSKIALSNMRKKELLSDI